VATHIVQIVAAGQQQQTSTTAAKYSQVSGINITIALQTKAFAA
jgi:hypothetical protein